MRFSSFIFAVFEYICICAAAESSLSEPAYVSLAPCPCDLTTNNCDIGCCCDTNCTPDDLSLAPCYEGYFGGRPTSNSLRSCNFTDQIYLPDYHVLTCVIIENNAYLGEYYPITNTTSTSSSPYDFLDDGIRQTSIEPRSSYKPGNLVVYNSPEDYRRFPQSNSDGICNKQAIVQYMQNVDSTCSFTVTSDTCIPSFPSILSTQTNNITFYYCNVNATLFVKSTTTTPTSIVYFSEDGCSYNIRTGYTCSKPSTDNVQDTSIQCTISPVAPSVDATHCKNTMLGAIYSFTWKNSSILNITANLLFGDVALNTLVMQRFILTWSNSTSASVTKLYSIPGVGVSTIQPTSKQVTQRTKDGKGLITRSGVVGYEQGSPLIGGKYSPSEGSFSYMDANYSSQPTIFIPGSDGFCATAGRTRASFRQDTLSTCNVAINSTTFNNCFRLRYYMKYRLDEMFPMDAIAMYGNPSLVDKEDWVKIIYSTEENRYALVNSTDTQLINNLMVCVNVTTGARLEIVVSKQGKARGQAIWQILGGRIVYNYNNWYLNCRNGDSQQTACSSIDGTAFIPLTFEISYLEANKTSPFNCWAGVCWEEAVYPWSATYLGEPLTYTRAMGCLILLFTLFIVIISAPFW